jgi:Concanavalin A-like lectin/glucanases superfamily/Cadherin domain
MRLSPIAFVGSAGQAPISFAGSFSVSHGATDSPIGSVGLSDISDTNAAANAVIENAANGAAVGITAFAVEPGETVTYTLTANPGGLFAVNLTTGVVTKAAALDAETAGNHNITVRATSTSGKTNDRAFSITVNDFDEFNVGVVTDTNGAANEVIESAANGSTVGITALATDLDVSDTVTYSLSDDAGGRFAIDSDTGVVTVADTGLLDFETETSHDITVLATSSDASTTPQNFTIAILNDVADDGLVPATRFEGTSTVLRRAANPTAAADGVNGTFAIPIKMMGDADPFDTKLQYIWSNETGSYIRRNADGKVEALFADSAGVERAKIISTNELEVGDGWVMLLVNPDKLYFGNTDETGTRTTGAATDIDWTSGFNWGEDSAGGNRGNFEIARPWLALEAYVLTLQANRDKFFTALTPLDLADIKTDGSGPTGTQALDLLPNGYSSVSQNAGGGGNYSTVGTPREGTGPDGDALTAPSGYTANAVTVTRNTDRLDSGANFAADGETVSVSGWWRRNGTLATRQFFWGGLSVRWEVGFDSSNRFAVDWFNPAGGLHHRIVSTAITDTDWHHIAFSIDVNGAGATVSHLYVDGVSDKSVLNDTVTTEFSRNRSYAIGNNQGGTTLGYDGDFAELWASSEFVDFSDTPTFEKFRSTGGKPVDLGSDGSTPTGTQPEIYLKDPAATIETNSGSDANLTEVGTFTDAASSPSD